MTNDEKLSLAQDEIDDIKTMAEEISSDLDCAETCEAPLDCAAALKDAIRNAKQVIALAKAALQHLDGDA